MQNFQGNSIKNFSNFLKLIFLHIWINQLLSFLPVKLHTQSFFLLGDMDDFIRACSDFTMRGTPINLQMG